jgi:hypothetical protein
MSEIEIKINPIFAAFTFGSIPLARAAWKACEDSPDVRSVSVWSANFGGLPLLVVLGEEQERVDATANVIMGSAGCLGNYLLDSTLKRFYVDRRYGKLGAELSRRLAAGETIEDIQAAGGIKQRASDQP